MVQRARVFFFSILSLLLLVCFAIIQLRYYSIIFPVLFGVLGLIIFIVLDWFSDSGLIKENESESEILPSTKLHNQVLFKVLPVLFLVFYSFSLLSLFLGVYTKSVVYYICISICAGILIVEIFSYRTQLQDYVILLKTLLLSINIVFVNHFVYPYGISMPDFGGHFPYLMNIVILGRVPTALYGYFDVFPLHYIFASMCILLTGYNPQSMYLLLGSFLIGIGILFIFIIGKRFVNSQFGLIASVLYTCLDYYLMYGEHPEHMAYNFLFALICLTLILYTYRFQKLAFYLLFACSTFAIIFIHLLTTAIVFITSCCLVLIDIYQSIQKREFSFPSKYIVVFFMMLIIITVLRFPDFLHFFSAISKDISLLLESLYIPPSSTVSLPVTTAPTVSLPVTTAPTVSLPVTTAPTVSLPVTTAPTVSLPVTAATAVIPSTIPPSVYDKLPLMTIFENILGSCLLVLVSVLGFCSCIKKRSWFGDFTLINGILISAMLGMGVLFSYVIFLPDRMYPFLQIFSLVFLATFGIQWMVSVFPNRKKSIVFSCVCIIVVLMSFFSLASIINGFETSLFAGNGVAYSKLYTTSQDVSFGEWRTSFIQNEKENALGNPYQVFDSTLFILQMENMRGPGNQYLVFDRTLFKTGVINSGAYFGQHSFESIDNGYLMQLNRNSSYYDNGLIILMGKNTPL